MVGVALVERIVRDGALVGMSHTAIGSERGTTSAGNESDNGNNNTSNDTTSDGGNHSDSSGGKSAGELSGDAHTFLFNTRHSVAVFTVGIFGDVAGDSLVAAALARDAELVLAEEVS